MVPLIGLLFQAPITRAPLLLIGLLVSGTLGFAAVGTLFAAMLIRAHSRDVLLPVLLYPITVPLVIAAVRGTASIFAVEPNLAMAQACPLRSAASSSTPQQASVAQPAHRLTVAKPLPSPFYVPPCPLRRGPRWNSDFSLQKIVVGAYATRL